MRRGKYLDEVLERFWDKVKVDETTGCWNWFGTKNEGGYGKFFLSGIKVYAHRFAYEVNKGKIPEGLQLDHICRNRRCVNPDHLEPVTQRDNILRGIGLPAINAKKTHCPKGHEYTKENTYFQKNSRKCKICIRFKVNQYYHNVVKKQSNF